MVASPQATGNHKPSGFHLAEHMFIRDLSPAEIEMSPTQTTSTPAAQDYCREEPQGLRAPAVLTQAPRCWPNLRQVSI